MFTSTADIETEDNIITEIIMYVAGGVLKIESNAGYSTNHGVEIALAMTDVQSLRFGGVGDMTATGIAADCCLDVSVITIWISRPRSFPTSYLHRSTPRFRTISARSCRPRPPT